MTQTGSDPAHRLGLALRLARRELRGGLKGFRIFLACLTLGVAAIAGVGSVSEAMLEGLRRDGRVLLGGDLELRLVHRPATEAQAEWLADRAAVSELAVMRAMARNSDPDGRRVLIELLAADHAYPLYGALRLDPEATLREATAKRDGEWGAALDPALLSRLGVALGDRLRIGALEYRVRATVAHAPDRASRGFTLGPSVLVARGSLAETGLEQPGSLVYYHYRLRLPDGAAAAALREDLSETYPEAGWRVRDTRQATPGLRRFILRLTQFLTLVGLTSLLVGGVGVGNAVRAYLEQRSPVIATLKCIGAPSRLIFQTYLAQILVLGLLGVLAGSLLGAVAPYAVAGVLGDSLGWETAAAIYPRPLAMGAAFGLLTALLFSLWPLARARHVPAAGLFRARLTPPGGRLDRGALLAIGACGAGLAGLAVGTAGDPSLAAIFVAGSVGALAVFRLAAGAVMRLARKAPRGRRPDLRLAVANLHRPGAPTGSVVMSLGLGLTVLVAIALIEGNMAREVTRAIPEQAPAFYFIDIQPDQVEDFEALVEGTAGVSELRRVPMLRGRITKIDGQAPSEIAVPEEVAWIFQGDRGLTWTREPPPEADLVAGRWWPEDYSGKPLVSLDAEVGIALGLTPGDTMEINLLGRAIEVTIANLRSIDWTDLTINFVMIFSPGLMESAPQTHLATVKTAPGTEDALEAAVTDRFANVSSVRVRDALDAFSVLIARIATAVRVTAAVALVAGILVLAGAVAAGHRRRVYDAVVLKVLGATRPMVGRAFLIEYGLLGLVTAAIAAIIGSLAAWLVMTEVMEMSFTILPLAVSGTALSAVAVTILFGLAGTWQALSQKAAPLLRNE